MKKVLVVDDEKAIVQMLSINLKSFGYEVLSAYDGYEALDIIQNEKIDIVLLDIMMPQMSGIEVCNKIKQNPITQAIPVILVSAKTQVEDKIDGLNNGADDYVSKPFDLLELKSRIEAALRQVEVIENHNKILQKGNLIVDLYALCASCDNKQLDLTLTEFKILCELVKNSQGIKKDELTKLIYSECVFQNKRILDVHMRNLRKKLECVECNCKIITLRGIGYKIEVQE